MHLDPCGPIASAACASLGDDELIPDLLALPPGQEPARAANDARCWNATGAERAALEFGNAAGERGFTTHFALAQSEQDPRRVRVRVRPGHHHAAARLGLAVDPFTDHRSDAVTAVEVSVADAVALVRRAYASAGR